MLLKVRTPLPASLRLLRDGKEVARSETDTLDFAVTQGGIYRVEAALTVGGERRAWIYTGAIRVLEKR